MRLTGKLALAAAGLAALVTAGPAAADEPIRGGTFVIISSQVPRHFNPAVQSGTATARPGGRRYSRPRSGSTRNGTPIPTSPRVGACRTTGCP